MSELPQFALFDEFGRSCDDRVQDHYHAEISRLQSANRELADVLARAQKWIEGEMMDKGWPQERVKEPPAGSHLHAIAAALARHTTTLEKP